MDICSISDLRNNIEIARELAKARVAFVVVPVETSDEYVRLSAFALKRLEAIAAKAEKEQG